MKAALWLRVSTTEQDTENQRRVLEAEAQRRGLEISEVYNVQASAFQGAHLKALDRVYKDARANRFKVLLVWSLDRLTRQGSVAMLETVDTLMREGVEVVSIQESWIPNSGPFRELFLLITGWASNVESERRSERTKAGMARARANGVRIGRPPGAKDKKKRKAKTLTIFQQLEQMSKDEGASPFRNE